MTIKQITGKAESSTSEIRVEFKKFKKILDCFKSCAFVHKKESFDSTGQRRRENDRICYSKFLLTVQNSRQQKLRQHAHQIIINLIKSENKILYKKILIHILLKLLLQNCKVIVQDVSRRCQRFDSPLTKLWKILIKVWDSLDKALI